MTFRLNSSQLGEARVSFTAGWPFPADESKKTKLVYSRLPLKLNTILSNVCMVAAGADMHWASSDFETSKPSMVSGWPIFVGALGHSQTRHHTYDV